MLKKIKGRTLRRLKIIEGQIRGVQRMVEEEKYCVDILHQSSAIKRALSGVEELVLENHLLAHTAKKMRDGGEKKAAKEILDIYRLSKKYR